MCLRARQHDAGSYSPATGAVPRHVIEATFRFPVMPAPARRSNRTGPRQSSRLRPFSVSDQVPVDVHSITLRDRAGSSRRRRKGLAGEEAPSLPAAGAGVSCAQVGAVHSRGNECEHQNSPSDHCNLRTHGLRRSEFRPIAVFAGPCSAATRAPISRFTARLIRHRLRSAEQRRFAFNLRGRGP